MNIWKENCSTCEHCFYCEGAFDCIEDDEDLWLYESGADLCNTNNLPANNWQ